MRPSPLDRFVNRLFGFLVKIGFGLAHNFLLEVQGRKSGRTYSTPVNVLIHENKMSLAITVMMSGALIMVVSLYSWLLTPLEDAH